MGVTRLRWAVVPGTCGELIQGSLAGVDFLVSCPCDRYVRARFRPHRSRRTGPITGLDGRPKVARALEVLLGRHGLSMPAGHLEINTELTMGKGMGSSTAEIVAASAALADHLGLTPGPTVLADVALAVEPSDSIMYPGLAIMDHLRGRIRGPLGEPPPIEILILDQGGSIDTHEFNDRRDLPALNREKEPLIRNALALLVSGIRRRRAMDIGRAATMSARAHQSILPKPALESIISLAEEARAVGVTIAHSGTVMGILCDPFKERADRVGAFLERRLGTPLKPVRLVGGGMRWEDAVDE